MIRHYLQKKTTVDHPRIVKEADERHYDIVFSVMQGQQQLTLLPVLSSLNADLLVLVGNNMETDKCEEALKNMPHLYGFQDSAGHREDGVTVAGRLPVTGLTVGGLNRRPSDPEILKLKKAFNVSGYKITPVANFCFPRMKAGDVKMYNRNEILELMKTAGFKKVKYRKISPLTFQCIAKKQRI